MKLDCGIVRDLMDMYAEEMCSEASARAVEEHLAECGECRAQLERIRKMRTEEVPCEICREEISVARSFRKIRRRWIRSVIAALLVLPVLILSINQYLGQGICFTNMDEILLAYRYARALEAGDFERAAGYMDYDDIYSDIQAALSWKMEDYGPIPEDEARRQYEFNQAYYDGARNMMPEEFETFMKAYYVECLQALADGGAVFKSVGYKWSYYIEESDCWVVEWAIQAKKDGGVYPFVIAAGVSGGKISIGAMSHAEEKWLDEVTEAIFMSWPGEE